MHGREEARDEWGEAPSPPRVQHCIDLKVSVFPASPILLAIRILIKYHKYLFDNCPLVHGPNGVNVQTSWNSGFTVQRDLVYLAIFS